MSLAAVATLVTHVACSSGESDDATTGDTATVTNGTGNDPVCEGGVRDGRCNALGEDPESCECLDCAQTAYCKDKCVDDGQCQPDQGEDCTCADCVGQQVGEDTCPHGGGGGPSTTAPSSTEATAASGSTDASTAASTAASTSSATTAASTSSATTAASTTASSSASGAGGSP